LAVSSNHLFGRFSKTALVLLRQVQDRESPAVAEKRLSDFGVTSPATRLIDDALFAVAQAATKRRQGLALEMLTKK